MDIERYFGGGAVCAECAHFSANLSTFISCRSTFFSGGILAQRDCGLSIVSFCTFISCEAMYGGGLMTYCGPHSEIISSRFISCTGFVSGGGLYHESEDETNTISITDTLFFSNCADNSTDGWDTRGGGGFEDFHSTAYYSLYSFTFFHKNIAKYSYGHDLSTQGHHLSADNLHHCFTTTTENSF